MKTAFAIHYHAPNQFSMGVGMGVPVIAYDSRLHGVVRSQETPIQIDYYNRPHVSSLVITYNPVLDTVLYEMDIYDNEETSRKVPLERIPYRVKVYFPYDPETRDKIDVLAEIENGESMGSGLAFRGNEMDSQYMFPTMEHAQLFAHHLCNAFPGNGNTNNPVAWCPFAGNGDFCENEDAIWRNWQTSHA